MTVSVPSSGLPAGSYTIVVTNDSGTNSAALPFTVNAPGC
jgi:hypothetical protein